MQNDRKDKGDLARRIQNCLKEAGVNADLELSEHEALVHAQVKTESGFLKIVAHLTDRDPKLKAAGFAAQRLASVHRGSIAIRPTLATQAASRKTIRSEVSELLDSRDDLGRKGE